MKRIRSVFRDMLASSVAKNHIIFE